MFAAGGALCLVAGYLIGAATGPDTDHRTTAVVASYDAERPELCLTGEGVKDHRLTDEVTGQLCGAWRRVPPSPVPKEGDSFRYVAVSSSGAKDDDRRIEVVIYGAVVR